MPLGLNHFYTVKNNEITGRNGTRFTFKGLRTNLQSIKSMFGIKICWVEEAQTVSQIAGTFSPDGACQ